MFKYQYVSIKNRNILVLRWKKKEDMNSVLDEISNRIDGVLNTPREGHNFPKKNVPSNHKFFIGFKNYDYVIAVSESTARTAIPHEMCHARFYLDEEYKDRMINMFNSFTEKKKEHIFKMLKRMGYCDNVLIDEWQAYYNTEALNFFGN